MDEFTEHTGVVLREDGTLFIWSDNTRIEVILSPEQMLTLANALYEKAGISK